MSNDNIVPLRGSKPAELTVPKAEPNKAMVQMLEHLVELAIAGKISGFAFTTIDTDGDVMTAWTSDKRMAMAGAISILSHRYLKELLEDDDK